MPFFGAGYSVLPCSPRCYVSPDQVVSISFTWTVDVTNHPTSIANISLIQVLSQSSAGRVDPLAPNSQASAFCFVSHVLLRG